MHPGHYQTPKAGISMGEEQAGTPLFTSLHCISLAPSHRCYPEDTKIKPVSFVVKLIPFSTSLKGKEDRSQGQERVTRVI